MLLQNLYNYSASQMCRLAMSNEMCADNKPDATSALDPQGFVFVVSKKEFKKI